MSYSPFAIKELKWRTRTTTFATTFTAPNDSAWTNATKLRVHDLSADLKYDAGKDMTVQSRFHGHPKSIETIKSGTLKFKMYLEGGSATTAPTTVATLLGKVLGGIKSPTAISDTAETSSGVSNIKCATHGQVAGQAVLVGTRGDGRADGKASIIDSVLTNEYWLRPNLPVAPNNGDAIKHGHTVYFDGTVQNYEDFLLIGHYAGSGVTDDCDQIQMIGCSGTVAFGGFKPGELAFVEFTFNVGDWRNEAYATKASMTLTSAGSGGDPAGNQATGAFTIQDASLYTRTTVTGGDIEVNPNVTIQEVKDPNGVNGRGGFIHVPSDSGPTCGITRYFGNMPEHYDDFTDGTAKQVVFQFGHETAKTVVIDLQRAFITSVPERVEFEKSMALKLQFEADSGQTTDESTDDYKLQDSPMRIHFL